MKKPGNAAKIPVPLNGTGLSGYETVLDFLSGVLSKRMPGWLRFPSLGHSQSAFHNMQIQICAIRGLSQIVAASYTEDQFGVVQRNLGAVVSSLVNLLLQLERYLPVCFASSFFLLSSSFFLSSFLFLSSFFFFFFFFSFGRF